MENFNTPLIGGTLTAHAVIFWRLKPSTLGHWSSTNKNLPIVDC